jgi:hypothetical protein
MSKTLAKIYWVDPRVAYLYKWDANVEISPILSKTYEEYAVTKFATRINKKNMLEDYHKLQREGNSSSIVLSMSDIARVFHYYLKCLCNDGHDGVGGLFYIITRFTKTYKWPVLDEHFRTNS